MEKVRYFSADFRDGRVYVAGKSYAAGSFAVHLLRQAYIKDTLARIGWYRLANERVQDFLQIDYLDENDFLKAGEEIGNILKYLPLLKPFCFLNTEAERQRVAALFTEENAHQIISWLHLKTELLTENPSELYIQHAYDLPKDPSKCEGARLMPEVLSTLRFYTSLGDDTGKAYRLLKQFVSRLDEVDQFDESHLLPLAQNVFGPCEFGLRVEYIPFVQSGKTSVARRLSFENYYSFVMTDFYEGLHFGHYPRKCEACKRYFLMKNARKQKYCNGYMTVDGKKIACRRYAAQKSNVLAREKADADPVRGVYRARCSMIRQYEMRGKITKKFSDLAKKLAKDHMEQALSDDEYARTRYAEEMSKDGIWTETERTLNP